MSDKQFLIFLAAAVAFLVFSWFYWFPAADAAIFGPLE